jgi:competence protein ComEA
VVEHSRGQLIAYGVAALLLVAAAVKLLSAGGRGPSASAPVRIDRAGGGALEGRPRGAPGGGVYVHVAGAVRRPGLYRVPRGSRIATALERAGGPTRRAELSAVNLAAQVQDGQQVLVPRAGAAGGMAAPGSATTAAPAGGGAAPGGAGAAPGGQAGAKISLATATVEQLDGIDGIGPTLAKRIVEYRDAHGGFRSIEQLREVEGIGEKRFETLRDALQP